MKTDATLPSPRAGALRRFRPFVMPAGVVIGVFALVTWAASHPGIDAPGEVPSDVSDVVARADAHLQDRWQKQTWNGQPLQPAKPAGDLVVLRRLSLALHGTVPSLEEIRQFEADEKPDRLQRWTVRLLEDDRFATYFAERLARGYVSTEGGTFVLYRRDRFTSWLRSQLKNNTPYDAVVRKIISSTGLWTGTPSTNFMTYAYNEGKFDVNKLTGRTVRAFLGQRFDCAQCHDHPFDDRWKQHHFEGLAAYYGQARLSAFGVEDREYEKKEPIEYVIKDRETLEERVAKPGVPFHPEWLPEEGTRREKLAAWITHPKNRRFERATVNRVWALLFGYGLVNPVDDFGKHNPASHPQLLNELAADFVKHDYDLRRLFRVLARSRGYQLASQVSVSDSYHPNLFHRMAVKSLNAGQIYDCLQIAMVKRENPVTSRFNGRTRFNQTRQAFVSKFEAPTQSATEFQAGIPQALTMMNGSFIAQATDVDRSDLLIAVADAPFMTDEQRVETLFLAVLSRKPTPKEHDRFAKYVAGGGPEKDKRKALGDVMWALLNSTEFILNH